MNTEQPVASITMPPTGSDLQEMPLSELQDLFNQLDASVKVAEPKVAAMHDAYFEAKTIFDDLKYRRGHVAYWLTIRKGQR